MSTPSQCKRMIRSCIELQIPFFMTGPVGAGKSQSAFQVTEALKIDFTDVRLSQMDPTDIKGFPSPDAAKNLMRWLPADFLPRKGKGLLFLDELNSAPPSVQAAAYQLVLDRRVGSYTLPPGWVVGAAGNRDIDRAIVNKVSSALNNRFLHIEFEVDLGDFVAHAAKNGVSVSTIAFLRFKSDLLHSFDATQNPKAFPTPRSWFTADKIVRAKLPSADEHSMLVGAIGNGAAIEYTAFMRVIKDLPSVDEIALAPDTTKVPDSPATLFALTTSLSMATKTKTNFGRFLQYVERMEKEWQVVYIRDCLKTFNEIKLDSNFTKWCIANKDIVL